jgi:serine phosphatase RsbU (regulator of sigma subunit)
LHQLQINEGDSIYLYTDGYADQFGGIKGKKYMYKKLNQKLSELNTFGMDKQLMELETEFDTWKGELEQVDDMCVLGIKF